MSVEPHTEFAPAERASWERLYQQVSTLNANSALKGVLHDTAERILILNAQRQIVYANAAILDTLELADPAQIYGCRPGEVLGCIYADQGEGGCGTSIDCQFCGALNAVLPCLKGYPEVRKCELIRREGAPALDFVLNTFPLRVDGATMCLVTITLDEAASPKQIAHHTFATQRYAAMIEQAEK